MKLFEVYRVNLDPTVGNEIRKSRPCVIVSPDEMSRHVKTAIVAPMTSQSRFYPRRVEYEFQGMKGERSSSTRSGR